VRKIILFVILIVMLIIPNVQADTGSLGLEPFINPMFIYKQVVTAVRISGVAMQPTLSEGDILLVNKWNKSNLRRGDIIVYDDVDNPKMKYIKRVVAFEGETVEIKQGKVFINGSPLEDEAFKEIVYVSMGEYGISGKPYIVPASSLFVLGDNSRNSLDSRMEGAIPKSSVFGKAYSVIWPYNSMKSL